MAVRFAFRAASRSRLNSVLPRFMGSGPWKYHDMIGYTSVGASTRRMLLSFPRSGSVARQLQASSRFSRGVKTEFTPASVTLRRMCQQLTRSGHLERGANSPANSPDVTVR